MTLTGLSFAYLRDRGLTTALNILLIGLAVAAMVILVLFTGQLQNRFTRDVRGIDLVVGAKGSPLQLILSSVLHVDVPTGNVPLETLDRLRSNRMVRQAIPLALGDNFRGFRIVGTEPAYPAHYGAELARGRMFAAPMEAIVGADVARETGAPLGQEFAGTHGLGGGSGAHEHEARPFKIVGVLRPTGTVVDRLILTPVESVWDIHGIAHEDEESAHGAEAHAEDHEHAEGEHEAHENEAEPAEHDAEGHEALAPELTAILVSYRTPMAAIRLPGEVNEEPGLQAAVPALETTRLLQLVGVGVDAMRALAVLLLVSGGVSIFVALYTALRYRQADMAMLRVIGSRPQAIFGQVVLEGLLLAGAGALLGLVLGHAVVAVATASSARLQELGLDAFRFDPAEGWIVVAALAVGVVAALLPAIRVFRVNLAQTLARA